MEESPQWLNMIPKDREWHARESKRRHGVSEDKKLELRLGPPGEDRSLLSLSYLPSMASITHLHTNSHGAKRGFQDTLEAKPWPRVSLSSSSSAFEKQNHQPKSSYLQYPVVPQTLGAIVDESSKPRPTSMADQVQQYKDKMACSVAADASVSANTAVPNSSQKRFTTFSCLFFPLLFPRTIEIWKKQTHIFPLEIRNYISIMVSQNHSWENDTLLSLSTRHDNGVSFLNMNVSDYFKNYESIPLKSIILKF